MVSKAGRDLGEEEEEGGGGGRGRVEVEVFDTIGKIVHSPSPLPSVFDSVQPDYCPTAFGSNRWW